MDFIEVAIKASDSLYELLHSLTDDVIRPPQRLTFHSLLQLIHLPWLSNRPYVPCCEGVSPFACLVRGHEIITQTRNYKIHAKRVFSQLRPRRRCSPPGEMVRAEHHRWCAAAAKRTGWEEMKISRWLMLLPPALSVINHPEVIWLVHIESNICNEIIDSTQCLTHV